MSRSKGFIKYKSSTKTFGSGKMRYYDNNNNEINISGLPGVGIPIKNPNRAKGMGVNWDKINFDTRTQQIFKTMEKNEKKAITMVEKHKQEKLKKLEKDYDKNYNKLIGIKW